MNGIGRGTKRGRTSDPVVNAPKLKQSKLDQSEIKKVKHSSHGTNIGLVLTLGEGDTGQLGLGPDTLDRTKPAQVNLDSNFVQVCAGGMHTVCLNEEGQVFTFGCNDEFALGRATKDEEEMEPGLVQNLNEKVIQVSAGDSHTAALTEDGKVFIWGTFRDANGSIGLTPKGPSPMPIQILKGHQCCKISSGTDHLMCLTVRGQIYSLGNAEQGQLGRVAECFSNRGGRKKLGLLLTPDLVKCRQRNAVFVDVWTGQYTTYAMAKTNDIYAWGLNNYWQLGLSDGKNRFTPTKAESFGKDGWLDMAGGQHHTVALNHEGKVFTLGRKEYGRLGLGENLVDKAAPTQVVGMSKLTCTRISCGTATSFAVTNEGKGYGWGMGSSRQLAQKEDDDLFVPTLLEGRNINDREIQMISGGGQHTALLASDE